MMIVLVNNGFSLQDIRQLYVDELPIFHDELIYVMEQRGQIKEGSYNKLVGKTDPAKSLKAQLFSSF